MVTKSLFRRNSSRLLTFVLCVTVFFLVTGCRRQDASAQPTVQPTIRPTPRSTPLPALPTAIAPGEADNPLQMVIRPVGDMKAAEGAAAAFEKAILDESGLVVQVKLVERYAEALAALCGSGGGSASAVWLNGFSYTAARAQNCGLPLMQVERGTGSNVRSGEGVSIIIPKSASFSSIASLKDKTFCRIGYDDLSSWLLPSLMLQANNIEPLSIKTINDYADIPKLVKGVAEGDCDAAGIPANALEQFADDIGEDADKVKVLDTSIEFPYAILMVPIEVPLGTRLTLNNTLLKLADNSTTAVKMRALLGQNGLAVANSDDFNELAEFMTSTGLDFAQLGN